MRKIFTLMLSLLAIAISAAAQTPDVVLEFTGAANDGNEINDKQTFISNMQAGSDFVAGLNSYSKVYPAKSNWGLKVGTGSAFGKVVLDVAESYQREVEKIVVSAKSYNASRSYLQINGQKTAQIVAGGANVAFEDYTLTGFTGVMTTLSIETVDVKKAIVIKSISIYFKDGGIVDPGKETVATPEITCVDNVVTISCATEGAAITYTIDGGEAIDYAEPFEITKTCTIEATASMEEMNPATASVVCKFKRVGALEIDGVEYAEDAIEMLWNVVGVDGENAATAQLNKSLLTNGAAGTWTAVHEKCYAKTDGGTAHLGSGSSTFKGGTITLTGSELPADAYITSVSVSGRAASKATMTWGVSVNGIAASNTVVFDSADDVTKTIDEVELLGNELVLTLNDATANKAFYLSGISVSYMVPAEPEAPVMLDKPEIKHGTKVVWTVKYGKLHYRVEHAGAKSVMARGTDVTEDWTEATENGGKQFTYEYASGANHNVYVKNVVNGKEAYGEAFNINETGGLTGIESVSAEGAEGVRELYNLQGVRVSEAEAAAGVYIERRGGKVAKVVIR